MYPGYRVGNHNFGCDGGHIDDTADSKRPNPIGCAAHIERDAVQPRRLSQGSVEAAPAGGQVSLAALRYGVRGASRSRAVLADGESRAAQEIHRRFLSIATRNVWQRVS